MPVLVLPQPERRGSGMHGQDYSPYKHMRLEKEAEGVADPAHRLPQSHLGRLASRIGSTTVAGGHVCVGGVVVGLMAADWMGGMVGCRGWICVVEASDDREEQKVVGVQTLYLLPKACRNFGR